MRRHYDHNVRYDIRGNVDEQHYHGSDSRRQRLCNRSERRYDDDHVFYRRHLRGYKSSDSEPDIPYNGQYGPVCRYDYDIN